MLRGLSKYVSITEILYIIHVPIIMLLGVSTKRFWHIIDISVKFVNAKTRCCSEIFSKIVINSNRVCASIVLADLLEQKTVGIYSSSRGEGVGERVRVLRNIIHHTIKYF